MAGLRDLFRHWQIAHYELQRSRLDEAGTRSRVMLGAYGLTPTGEPSAPSRRSR